MAVSGRLVLMIYQPGAEVAPLGIFYYFKNAKWTPSLLGNINYRVHKKIE